MKGPEQQGEKTKGDERPGPYKIPREEGRIGQEFKKCRFPT